MPTRRRWWGALLLLLGSLILAACGAGPVSHPTGARDIVVRLSATGGGMLPGRLYYYEGQFPPFTLFGDGTLVYAAGGFYQAHLDEAAIQRLLTLAVNDVHFFDLPDSVGPTCCDMPHSQLIISAGGQTKAVGMSLLDEKTDSNSPERRLQRLLDALTALQTGQDPAYTPPGATLYAEIATGQPGPAAPAWPLTTVSLADVLTESDGNGLHLTGADAQAALQAAPRVAPFVEHGVSYLVVATPDPP
jgi:hypothetical protein